MTIKERLMEDFKAAMKAKDQVARDTISFARAAVKQQEIDSRQELSDEGVIAILTKQVKMRKDALADFEKAGRTDLTDSYRAEIEILNRYLPQQLSEEDILKTKGLKILAESEEAGVYAVSTDEGRRIFIMGHSEYDTETLASEYFRDKEAGLDISVPKNYFPGDDDSRRPSCDWRSGANLLYSNWLNYFVYQSTPYDINTVPPLK